MDSETCVQRDEFEASISGLVAVLGKIAVTQSAIALILHHLQIVTPDLWKQFMDESELNEYNRRVQESVEKLRQIAPHSRLPKAFEGMIQ